MFVGYFYEFGVEIMIVEVDVIDVVEFECMLVGYDVFLFFFGLGVLVDVGVFFDVVCIVVWLCMLMFGVCLGYQIIGVVFGMLVMVVFEFMYGMVFCVIYDGFVLFDGIFILFVVGCYYLLVFVEEDLLLEVVVMVWIEDGMVMVFVYWELFLFGVQFYFESVFIEGGYCLLVNWLWLVGDEDVVVCVWNLYLLLQ